MRFPRIEPYGTHAIVGEERTPVEAHELVLERPFGVDLEVNLAPHPGYTGFITFSTFRGHLVLEAGAANELCLYLEDWPAGHRRRTSKRRWKRPTLGHLYAVDARGEKRPIPHRKFAIDVGLSADLELDFTPQPPLARHVCIRSDHTPLTVVLNASNVIHVSVDTRIWGAKASRKRTAKRRSGAPR